MSDHFTGCVVTFEDWARDDVLEPTLVAIRQIRGVRSVAPLVANAEAYASAQRARIDVVDKVSQVLREVMQGE